MNPLFVSRFDEARSSLRETFRSKWPDSYRDIVEEVIKVISSEDEYDSPNPNKIHQIDDGDYQGTLLYLIPNWGYQPSNYWWVMVSYGSCSGCDTLQAIDRYRYNDYGDELINEKGLDDLITLALHIVQRIKPLGDNE